MSVVLQKYLRQKHGGTWEPRRDGVRCMDPDTQLPLKLVGQEELEGRGICFRNEDDSGASLPSPCNSMPSTVVRKFSLVSTMDLSCCGFFLFPFVLA